MRSPVVSFWSRPRTLDPPAQERHSSNSGAAGHVSKPCCDTLALLQPELNRFTAGIKRVLNRTVLFFSGDRTDFLRGSDSSSAVIRVVQLRSAAAVS